MRNTEVGLPLSFSHSLNFSISQLRFFFDCDLAAIVTAGGAYSVIDVVLTAVGAYGQRGSNCSVVCSSFESPGLGLPSFWMCHFYLLFNDLLFTLHVELRRNAPFRTAKVLQIERITKFLQVFFPNAT